MKKWSLISLAFALLMWIVIICSYYAFSYPQTFRIPTRIRQVEWNPLLLLYLALLLLAATLAFIISRKNAVIKNFLKTVCVLQSAVILFFIISGLAILYKARRQYRELIRETEKRANEDMKRDAVSFVFHGLPIPNSNFLKRDSIRLKYGVHTTFSCIIDNFSPKIDEYYTQLTESYLNKRNGNGWKERMSKELAAYESP